MMFDLVFLSTFDFKISIYLDSNRNNVYVLMYKLGQKDYVYHAYDFPPSPFKA